MFTSQLLILQRCCLHEQTACFTMQFQRKFQGCVLLQNNVYQDRIEMETDTINVTLNSWATLLSVAKTCEKHQKKTPTKNITNT